MKKKLLVLISFFIFLNAAFSQSVVFTENFNYPSAANGDSIAGVNTGFPTWTRHSGGNGTNAKAVQYSTTPLTLAGYAGSGIGGSVTFQHTTRSQDINGNIGTPDSVGSVYASFLLRIDSSGGRDTLTDYFFHFLDGAGATPSSNFRGRLFACYGITDSITKFRLGISKGTNAKLTAAQITAGAKAPIFTSTEYNVGQTYLVVLKYTFGSASKDDTTKLFIFASGSLPATEPTANVTSTDGTVSDLARISSVCIRQGSTGKTAGSIDGIRVFTTWDAATVALLPIKLNSFNATGLKSVVNLNWSAICSENSCNFIVERSTDGANFSEISNTNATSKENYFSTDRNLPNASSLYYRLKIVSANGKAEYSTVQKVQLKDIKLSVSPNPTSNEILVNATSNIATVNVFDLTGKSTFSIQNNNTNSIRISVANLPEGTYVIKTTTVDGETVSNKIVVKH